jgi:hypothetical protein
MTGTRLFIPHAAVFRDQLIAASLKPLSREAAWASPAHFRDQLIAASLKRAGVSVDRASRVHFRDQLIAASLKRKAGGNVRFDLHPISAIRRATR